MTPKRDDRLIMETINNVHYIFSRRNKRASSVLRAFGRTASYYHEWNNKRIDQMAPEELVALARSMKKERQE